MQNVNKKYALLSYTKPLLKGLLMQVKPVHPCLVLRARQWLDRCESVGVQSVQQTCTRLLLAGSGQYGYNLGKLPPWEIVNKASDSGHWLPW